MALIKQNKSSNKSSSCFNIKIIVVLIVSIIILLALMTGIIIQKIFKKIYYYDTNYTKTVIGYYNKDKKQALILLKGNENNTQIKFHENKISNSIYSDDEIYDIIDTCAKQKKNLVPLGHSEDDFVVPNINNLQASFNASKDLISAFKTHDLDNILSVDTKDDLEFAYAYKSREKIDDLIKKYENLGFTFFTINTENKLTGTYLGKDSYISSPDMTDPYTKLIFNDNGTGSRNIGYDEQGNWIYESLTEDIHDDQMIYFIENEQIYTLDLICDRYTEINDIEKNCLDFFLASYARHYFYDKETDTIYEPLASNSSLEKIKADFINGTANPFDEIYKRIK